MNAPKITIPVLLAMPDVLLQVKQMKQDSVMLYEANDITLYFLLFSSDRKKHQMLNTFIWDV